MGASCCVGEYGFTFAGFWFKYHCHLSTLVLLALLAVSILVPVALLGRNAAKMQNNICNFNPPDATMGTIFEARTGPILEARCSQQQVILSQPDLDHQSVSRNTEGYGQSVYCAEFSNIELDNSRSSDDLGPVDVYINQSQPQGLSQSTEFLPLGGVSPSYKYLLSKSVFTVYLCLIGPVNINGPVPSVNVLLFRFKDRNNLQNAHPLERAEISFNGSLCSNTSITLSQSALIVAALSTPSTVTFVTIKGYLKHYHYDSKIESQLNNTTNLIGLGTTVQIKGEYFSKLLCYIEGGEDNTVIPDVLFDVLIPFDWSPWARPVLSSVIGLVLIMSVIIIIFCLGKCCKGFHNRRSRNGYSELDNPSSDSQAKVEKA